MKQTHRDALKCKREAEDQIKEAKEFIAKEQLRMPNKWETMYEKLVDYKIKHRNCVVPQQCNTDPELSKLGRWVGNQRASYKQYINGGNSYLTPQRISKLDELGFVW
eukprot:CAMPEP_0195512354 /NCGR_PEP_ID=MMETSP0794_2-20130614/4341_1 /TAXON_ID=515487 /ORGANISM="Stephanopyxis turris, Strain CCMP 815" /LENGTH=106 /DNA_ID=CAMNT_0040640117 /DNA_START=22 /DNA_END=339 /DNA_ORIENTATION=+